MLREVELWQALIAPGSLRTLRLTCNGLTCHIVAIAMCSLNEIKEGMMFDIHQQVVDEDGESDDALAAEYCDGLIEAFVDSPEGIACAEHYGEIGWTHSFLYYGLNYVGTTPPAMSVGDVEEILFELFPRKVSTEPDTAGKIIGELRAFWEFLDREYDLPEARAIVKRLDSDAERRLKRELSNPDNFGMAKSMVMMGSDAGFDMTTQEGMNQFVAAYNSSVSAGRQAHATPPYAPANYASPAPAPRQAVTTANLSADERKAREKLRRKKLGKSKRRR